MAFIKSPVFKVLIICFVIIFLLKSFNVSSKTSEKLIIPDEAEYIDVASFSYIDALLKNYENGTKFVFTGRVKQKIDNNYVMVAIYSGNKFSSDIVMLYFTEDSKLLMNDNIIVKARYFGTIDDKAILGITKTLPLFKVDYYEIGHY